MEKHEPDYKPCKSQQEERIYRYHLLDASRDAFGAVGGGDMGQLGLCSRFPRRFEVYVASTESGLFIDGVQHCHSVGCCPLCSYSAGIERCNEMGYYIRSARKEGFGVYLVSLTCSHNSKMNFRKLVSDMMAASSAMWRNGSFRRILDEWGYHGRITSFEVMLCGINGKHPHLHILLVADCGLDLALVKGVLLFEWKRSLKANDLHCDEHGADILGYEGVGDYVTKMQSELSLLNITKNLSKGGVSRSPMNTLVSWDLERKIEYAREWVSFVKGMKGKRITVWSRGLKKEAENLRLKYGFKLEKETEAFNGLLFLDDPKDYKKLDPWEWRMVLEMIYTNKLDRCRSFLDQKKVAYYINNHNLQEFLEVHKMN